MPRRTPDQGAKPFEVRTGVGGMPPLGGIYRAGDPATVPLNRHHMVVNARITPGGLYSRPGLQSLFDTQIAECIQGITEFNQLGGGLLIWPGAPLDAGNGGGQNNPVSMRTLFPTRSNTYSEYVFFVAGDLDPVSGNGQPIVDFAPNGIVWGTGFNQPFIHRGQVHYFRLDPLAGSWPILYVAPMPESSGVQGTDYYRATLCLTSPGVTTPGTAPTNACPPGTGWPRGHPFGVPEKVLEMPFEPWGAGIPYYDLRCISIPERGDQVLEGEQIVDATLYILATGITGTVYKTKLYRWNGTSLSEEAAAVVDFDTASDGAQYQARIVESGGGGLCIFVGGNSTSGDGGKAYVRGDSGAWSAVTGVRNGPAKVAFFPDHGFTWNGTPYFVGLGATAVTAKKVLVVKRGATSFEVEKDFFASDGISAYYVSHAGQVGPSLYFLLQGSQDYLFLPALVIHYDIPSKTITGSVGLRSLAESDIAREALWLVVSGTTCYAGGFMKYDPALAAPEATNCHSVWDVTDTTAPQMLYRVYEADYEEIYGNPYSFGAMPLIPAAGDTGQSSSQLVGGA
jgi:hypothetical protein